MALKQKEKSITKANAEYPGFLKKYKWDLLIVICSFLLYANSIPNEYNLDDELVTRNHRLTSKGISAIPEIFTSSYYQDQVGHEYEYRPIVLSSFAIENQFFGENPHLSHFINLLLYAFGCLLLFRCLLSIGSIWSYPISLTVVFLFMVHPAHTEVVDSIKNRDEILAFIFGMLSLYTAIKATLLKKKRIFIFTLLFYLLALLSKVTAISFVVLVPLFLLLFTEMEFIGIVILMFALVLITLSVIRNGNNIYAEVMVSELLIISLLIFYVSSNLAKSIEYFKSAFKSFTNLADFKNMTGIRDWDKINFKPKLTEILPSRETVFSSATILALIGMGFFLFGILSNNILTAAFGILTLFLLALSRQDSMIYWANILLSVSLVAVMIKYQVPNATAYGTMVTIVLLYQLFLGDRRFFLPSLILLGVSIYFDPNSISESNPIALLVFLLIIHIIIPNYSFKTKKKWLLFIPIFILIIALIISIVTTSGTSKLMSFESLQLNSTTYTHFFSLILLLTLALGKRVQSIIYAYRYSSVILLLTMLLSTHFISEKDTKAYVQKDSKESTKSLNHFDASASHQARVLTYIEDPISPNDPITIRLGTSCEVLFQYLHKVILPYPMAFYYGYKFIKPQRITDTIPLLSLLIYLALGVLAIFSIRTNKLIALGLIIYLVSTVSLSTYFKPIAGMLGDRLLLIPSLGWSIVLVAIFFRVFRMDSSKALLPSSSINKIGKGLLVMIILFYSGITFARNMDWKDDLTLFRHDIAYVDESAQAHNLLAIHLMQRTEKTNDVSIQREYAQEAIIHFKKSRDIYPYFFNTTFDVARVYGTLSEPDSAVLYFNRAISIDSTNTDSYKNISKILIAQKKLNVAVPYLEYVIRHDSAAYLQYQDLSYCYFAMNDFQKALGVCKTESRLMPQFPDPLINIGRIFHSMNMQDSSRIYLQKALIINPGNPMATGLLQQINGKK